MAGLILVRWMQSTCVSATEVQRYANRVVHIAGLFCALAWCGSVFAQPLEFHLHRGLNYLEFLGLSPQFTDAELKFAYLRAMKIHHTDAGGVTADAQFVNEAREVLADEIKFRAFLVWIKASEQPGERDPRIVVREYERRTGDRVPTRVSACEAALRYREARDLQQRPTRPRVDLSL